MTTESVYCHHFVCNMDFLPPVNMESIFLFGISGFLTLPFSIRVPPFISLRFLFFLKAVIGYSWNNSRRFLLVWRMFQFLQATAVRFGKNRLYVNINEFRFGSCCSRSFFCRRSSLTSLSTFSYCSSTSFWS